MNASPCVEHGLQTERDVFESTVNALQTFVRPFGCEATGTVLERSLEVAVRSNLFDLILAPAYGKQREISVTHDHPAYVSLKRTLPVTPIASLVDICKNVTGTEQGSVLLRRVAEFHHEVNTWTDLSHAQWNSTKTLCVASNSSFVGFQMLVCSCRTCFSSTALVASRITKRLARRLICTSCSLSTPRVRNSHRLRLIRATRIV